MRNNPDGRRAFFVLSSVVLGVSWLVLGYLLLKRPDYEPTPSFCISVGIALMNSILFVRAFLESECGKCNRHEIKADEEKEI